MILACVRANSHIAMIFHREHQIYEKKLISGKGKRHENLVGNGTWNNKLRKKLVAGFINLDVELSLVVTDTDIKTWININQDTKVYAQFNLERIVSRVDSERLEWHGGPLAFGRHCGNCTRYFFKVPKSNKNSISLQSHHLLFAPLSSPLSSPACSLTSYSLPPMPIIVTASVPTVPGLWGSGLKPLLSWSSWEQQKQWGLQAASSCLPGLSRCSLLTQHETWGSWTCPLPLLSPAEPSCSTPGALLLCEMGLEGLWFGRVVGAPEQLQKKATSVAVGCFAYPMFGHGLAGKTQGDEVGRRSLCTAAASLPYWVFLGQSRSSSRAGLMEGREEVPR